MFSFFGHAETSIRTFVTHGYAEFNEKVNSPDLAGKTKYCLFCADVNPDTNQSWCSDTDRYAPVVTRIMESRDPDDSVVFIKCFVGDRQYWKNKRNEFRTDPSLNLSGVPTLLKYGKKKKLVEDQLTDKKIKTLLGEWNGKKL